MKTLITFIMGIFLLSSVVEATDITGTWKGTVPGPDGDPLAITYVFESAGNNLRGIISTKLGGGPLSGGKIEGNKISFSVKMPANTVYVNGTLSGDEINMTQKKGDEVNKFTLRRVMEKNKIVGITWDNFFLDIEYYPSSVESGNVAIMFLGGSEGGIPKTSVKPFTAMGYPCLKVGYFGTEHTPDHLEMIPLEYFEKAIEMFKSQPEVKGKKIIVFGWSRGGELALLLASRYKQIEGVIAKVPSFPVFQGIGGLSSAWSYKGQPVPFVPYYQPYDQSKVVNNQWRELFELSLTQTDVVEKAMIKVERINGPILILTGQEDKMIPSSQIGDMIIKRLKDHKFPHWYKHYAYENTGHIFSEKSPVGGTPDGNKKARIDSAIRIFAFLGRLSGANE